MGRYTLRWPAFVIPRHQPSALPSSCSMRRTAGRGPHLALYDRSEDPTERTPFHIVLPPTAVPALVCTHPSDPYVVAEWDDHWISHIHIVDKEQH